MSYRLPRVLAVAIASALLFCSVPPAEAAKKKTQRPAATQTRAAAKPKPKPRPVSRAPAAPVKLDSATQLNRLYDEYWSASQRLNPLQATFQGEHRYDDQLPNYLSAASRQQLHDFMTQWLAKVEAVDASTLTGQDLLSREIFLRDARHALAAEKFPRWMLPINAYDNPASLIALLGSGMSAQPFNTVKDYDNWAKRAAAVPVLFDQAIANMREGMTAGVVQPRAVMDKVVPQLDAVLQAKAEDSIFWAPIRNMPAQFSDADRERLSADYRRLIENRLMPAYRALRGFIATEYLPASRPTDGMSALPDGAAWYQQIVASSTGDQRTAADVHQLSLAELTANEARIEALLKQARIRGKAEKVVRNLRAEKEFQFKDANELMARYHAIGQQVSAALPALIAVQPTAALDVRAVDPARAATATAASYQPSIGPGQPGVLYVNTHALPTRKRWAVPMQYLHEAIPGHHLQLGLQQEVTQLPRFRRQSGDSAFVEGWALYAESLGVELGLYQDPYDLLGYLYTQTLRSARMVADTGLHAAGWTRTQATDFLMQRAYLSREEAAADVERLLAQPGQTLAQRLGEMKIRNLRDAAQLALGDAFDVRAFHTEVLKDGSLPLDILQAKIERWVAAQSKAPTP